MDAVFFASKRAHYAGVRFVRPLVAAVGLTPARFDLMAAVEGLTIPTQRELRRTLGVARATLSEMLGALEGLGLVKRWACWFDMRTRLVELTALGRSLVRRVREKWMDSGEVTLAVDACLAEDEAWRDGLDLRRRFLELTGALRRRFGGGEIPLAFALLPEELEGGLASFEDEPEVPFVDETQ